MQLDLDWNKDFQEFQEILNCGITQSGYTVQKPI